MEQEVRWERMYLDELESEFARRPIVYLPYGLCEPHGPHNALGCDGLRAHAICCAAAHRSGGIVAPVHYWHLHDYGKFSEWAHKYVGQVQRTWLTPVPPWMFFRMICYQLRAMDVLGFHAVTLYTGHGGPHDQDADRFIDIVQPHVGARLAFICDGDDLRKDPDTDFEWLDHAGKGETSMLWAVEPACTDMSRLPDRDNAGPHFAMGENACEADRRQGEWMIDHKARHLIQTVESLLTDHERAQSSPLLTTFAAVEKLWSEVVAPALPDFASMKCSEFEIPEDSVWQLNWRIPENANL